MGSHHPCPNRLTTITIKSQESKCGLQKAVQSGSIAALSSKHAICIKPKTSKLMVEEEEVEEQKATCANALNPPREHERYATDS